MANKYTYLKVIQGDYGFGHGWEDLDAHECDSSFFPKDYETFRYNLRTYKTEDSAIAIRVVKRRELNR